MIPGMFVHWDFSLGADHGETSKKATGLMRMKRRLPMLSNYDGAKDTGSGGV